MKIDISESDIRFIRRALRLAIKASLISDTNRLKGWDAKNGTENHRFRKFVARINRHHGYRSIYGRLPRGTK